MGKNTIETVEKSLTDMFIRLVRIYPCLYSLSSSCAVGSLLGVVSSTSSVVAARPTPIHLKPLSATVVALIRFISHLNIKICKMLSLKLQIN